MGNQLIIKISADCEAISRENTNYDRVSFGPFSGPFVKKFEYLPELNPEPPNVAFDNKCAVVMEAGQKDLADILAERKGRGLEGRALRDAAAATAQCIRTIHSSGLVWSDVKARNFVVLGDEIGDDGSLPGVKGIDVESCEPTRSAPNRYTAAACAPEYAVALQSGTGPDFVLDYSYDIFGYGLLLFELATGKGFFAAMGMRGESRILSSLAVDDFEADVSDIDDDKLRDLIEQCLRADPRKRPSIVQILLHPYFVTTGVGPFGFKDSDA
jgi:serine/threonine protein kinase